MGDRDAARGEDLPFFRVHMHAVGGDHVLSQETEFVEPAHRGGAVEADAVLDFLARLADVDVEQKPVVPRERGAALEPLAADGIDGMRGDDELDAAAGGVLPVLDVVLEHLRLRLGMPVQHRDADGGAHARGLHGGHGLFRVEIHVVEESRAGGAHLPDGQLVAAPDVLRGELRLGGPDVLLEPFLQGQVVRRAAQQGHGRVRVRVEEAGEDGGPLGFEREVGGGVLRGVQVRELAFPDEDVGLSPFVLDMAEQDGLRHAELLLQYVVAVQDGLGTLQETGAALRQRDAAAAPLEEQPAGEFLQFGDVLAHGRLGDAQRLGRGGETAGFGGLDEYAQAEILDHNLYAFTARKACRSSTRNCPM